MKVIKPEWMHHDGDQILSLDIDPTGTRIATAGRGEVSGRICIWDMNVISKIINNEHNMEKYAIHAKLSEMEEHTGCVNCVRWSKNGQLLASGGDDCNVIIWTMKKMRTYTTDNSLKKREMWKSLHILQGHTGDILDIAWSYCEKFLASASIDNIIYIWDARRLPNILRKLVGHKSFVKGLAWDPVGEFLASQSDDKTIMIWSTLGFEGDDTSPIKPTAVIKKPFKKASSLTQFLRLAWSTDGQFIVSAHASNNTAPVAKIIERDSWICNKDCVGHRAAICSVTFNPNIYLNDDTTIDDISIICALGSRDGTLSLWKFPQKRPFCVVHNLFISAIVDMSWSSNGGMLLVSSIEGNLSFLIFNDMEEFSRRHMNPNEIKSYHNKLYGLNIKTAYEIPKIPISAEFLINNTVDDNHYRHETKREVVMHSHEKRTNSQNLISSDKITTSSDTSSRSRSMNQSQNETQRETILKDGRKRITPILISAPIEDSPCKDDKTTTKSKRKTVHFEDFEFNVDNEPTKPTIGDNNSSALSSSVVKSNHSSNLIARAISRRSTNVLFKRPPISLSHEFNIQIDNYSYNISVKNESKTHEPKTYELRCMRDNQSFWQTYLLGKVVFLYHNDEMIVCTTEDNRLHVFNYNGWRIFPQLVISDIIIGLFVSCKKYVIIVTTFGEIMIWELYAQKILYRNIYVPMDNMIAGEAKSSNYIRTIDIHSKTEQPIITINDYTTYVYNNQLSAWLPLTDKLCYFAGCSPTLSSSCLSSNICQLDNIHKFYSIKNYEIKEDEHSTESINGCISFLFNQMDVYVTLCLEQEFTNIFILLVRFLTQHNQDRLILSLCEHLSNMSMTKNDILSNNIGLDSTYFLGKLYAAYLYTILCICTLSTQSIII